MIIRRATKEDCEAIAAAEAASFPAAEAATKESFTKRLEVFADCFWLLYDEKGQLVSFVNGMASDERNLVDEMYENALMHKPDGEWLMIFGVVTIPEFRRRGYAGQVLDRVITDSKSQGRKGIVLTCKEEKIPFYSKFGFENEGVSQSVHGDAVWYQMRLQF